MSVPYKNYITEYHSAIRSGKVTVGEWIRKLYDKIDTEIKSGVVLFDAKKANKAITFIENFCHHSKGRCDLLKLELWQKATVSLIFGIVDKEGIRQYREVFLIVGRKNGKSLFASAIIAYMAYLDGEYGAEIYCLAPKLEQAGLVFDCFHKMVLSEDELKEISEKRRNDIYIPTLNTYVRTLAFNASKSDGFNPHMTVCDEIASWPANRGLKQYEVMKSALGARRQPLILSISTAGYINDGPYDELMKRSTAVLQGSSEETRLLPILYIIDDITQWDNIEELKKANPNMGVSVTADFFREEIAIAKNSLSKKAEFLCKYCNIKQNSVCAWMPYAIIDRVCTPEISLEDFRSCYCVGGIDLSQSVDLSSACIIVERDGILYTFSKFWMPANKVAELQEREGVPYDLYIKQGLIETSGENYIDYNDCYNWFCRLLEEYEIIPLEIGYDRFSAQYLVQQMTARGFHMDDVYQGFNLSPVLLEADGLLRDGKLILGRNNVLKAHFLNSALKQDTENRKYQLVKVDSRCHIDGCAAVIDALTVRQKWWEQYGEMLRNVS